MPINEDFESGSWGNSTSCGGGCVQGVNSTAARDGNYGLQAQNVSGTTGGTADSGGTLNPGEQVSLDFYVVSQCQFIFVYSHGGNCGNALLGGEWVDVRTDSSPKQLVLGYDRNNDRVSTDITLNTGQWYTLTVEWSSGGTVTASVNGYSVSSSAPYDRGSEYGFTMRNGETYVDNISSPTSISPPDTPQNVSATVNSNSSIDVNWDPPSDWGGEQGNYRVQISRDGSGYVNPSGGPTTLDDATTSGSYGPNSDYSYTSQVGIDSSFVFRVRAENSAGNSSWAYSERVYTDSITPEIRDVSRPDSSTIDVTLEKRSENLSGANDYLYIQFREDTGSGYGSWQKLDAVGGTDGSYHSGDSWNSKGSVTTLRFETNTTYQYSNSFGEDSRVQFRIRDNQVSPNQSGYAQTSEWVYTDYGNQGNVYLDTQFDSQTWDYEAGSPELYSSGINDMGVSGPQFGSNFALMRGGEDIEFNFSSIDNDSSVEDVVVMAWVAVGSMDTSGEDGLFQWYDGSSWQDITGRYGWEYNKQGWFVVHTTVPSSYVSGGNNNLRIRNPHGGGGDYFGVDRVIVSDLLHEYTTPAAPTDLVSRSTGVGTLELQWTDNASFEDRYEIYYRQAGNSTWNLDHSEPSNSTAAVVDNLGKATRYELKTRDVVEQPRNGSVGSYWYNENIHPEITTPFGAQKIETSSGLVDVPVFDVQEVPNPIVRTYTENGVAALNFVSTGSADLDQIRINTENDGVLGLKSYLEK